MAQVPDKTLQWLYSVLGEYRDRRRAYSDTASALSISPSLSPRTEIYHHDDGSSALLLTLAGTLPVSFRGTTYNFPLKLWIPHLYPQTPPLVYIDPGGSMQVRRGQHVDGQGRVYHPYLRDWLQIRNGVTGNIVGLLSELARVFEREPPVVARQQEMQTTGPTYPDQAGQPLQQQHERADAFGSLPPSLPPKPGRAPSTSQPEVGGAPGPPPRPPKPGSDHTVQLQPAPSLRSYARDGPPLPPLPHQQPSSRVHPPQHYPNGSSAANLAAQPYPERGHHQKPMNHDRSPSSPVSPVAPGRDIQYAPPLPVLPQHAYGQPHYPAQTPPLPNTFYPHQQVKMIPQRNQRHPVSPSQTQITNQLPVYPSAHPAFQMQPAKPPAPDLLTDPFDIALPTRPMESIPAPPIPPNPQKESLIALISQSLNQQIQQRVSQNMSFTEPLQAQQFALRNAHDRLRQEIAQLDHLSSILANNETILRRAIQDCDRTITEAKQKPQPPIDEVLVPTSVVANQLWSLCAEEAAIREAMYVLQKGVDRGRVSAQDFIKQMRALGREAFIKKAHARRCGRGLGLDTR